MKCCDQFKVRIQLIDDDNTKSYIENIRHQISIQMSSVNIHTERRESLELASMHVDKVFRTRMETTFQCNLIFSGTSADITSK